MLPQFAASPWPTVAGTAVAARVVNRRAMRNVTSSMPTVVVPVEPVQQLATTARPAIAETAIGTRIDALDVLS
jgi:hypothetical protein